MNRHDETEGLKALGSGTPYQAAPEPDRSLLEAFPNRYPERVYMVSIIFPEYTSLCPVTGQPDFGTIAIEYVPDKLCVESKSFKLYMFAWRNERTFMETVTNTILDDLCAVINPHWCRVKGLFVPRGGTQIHVFAEKYKSSGQNVREFVTAWRLENAPHKLA